MVSSYSCCGERRDSVGCQVASVSTNATCTHTTIHANDREGEWFCSCMNVAVILGLVFKFVFIITVYVTGEMEV